MQMEQLDRMTWSVRKERRFTMNETKRNEMLARISKAIHNNESPVGIDA